MPCSLQVVRTNEFVRASADGRFDLESSKRALAGIAKACIDRGVNCALVDIRDAEKSLSIEDLYRLAQSFQEAGFTHEHRLAILHRYSTAERADLFAQLANARGWDVSAFDNYEDAIEWFTSTQVLIK